MYVCMCVRAPGARVCIPLLKLKDVFHSELWFSMGFLCGCITSETWSF